MTTLDLYDRQTLRMPITISRWRFLLDDGRVVDVVGHCDDSTMREWLRKRTGAERIIGSALVEDLPEIYGVEEQP